VRKFIATRGLLAIWNLLSSYPGGKWLFSIMVGRFAPYSGSISARIKLLEPGKSIVSITDRPRLRNHLGSVHAIALINLGELSSGLALFTVMPNTHRGIITSISMQYLKKARGHIEANCEIAKFQWIDGDMDKLLQSKLYDQSGNLVAIAEVNWRLGLKNASASQQ